MRKAGDLIREFVLSNNRANRIGRGAYGIVYESDVPNRVIKQAAYSDVDNNMTNEANLQAIAADLGLAPAVTSLERFPGGIGNRIEMEDVRPNFERRGTRAIEEPTGMDAVRVNQQLGQLALNNVELSDRHNSNVFYNKMTGRPRQIDFGIAQKVEGSSKVQALTEATANGFKAAGIPDMGDMLRGIVYDYLEGGQVDEAYDVARQGFSRLQKIKKTL